MADAFDQIFQSGPPAAPPQGAPPPDAFDQIFQGKALKPLGRGTYFSVRGQNGELLEPPGFLNPPPNIATSTSAAPVAGPGPSAGSVMASGAEAGLGGLAGMPVDLAQTAGNAGIWAYNKIRDQFNSSPDLFTRPQAGSHVSSIPSLPGGSESIFKGMESAGLKPRPNLTEPWQKYLYAGTAGAAGLLPTMLIPGAGEITAGKILGETALGGGSGLASQGGQDLARLYDPNNPGLQTAAGIAAGLLPGAGSTVGRMAARPFLQSGQRAIAGNILNQEARGGQVQVPTNLPPGFRPTTGQANPNLTGIVGTERTFEQNPQFGPDLIAQQQANQANLRGHLQSLSSGQDNDAASMAINYGLRAYKNAYKTQEHAAWRAIDPGNTVPLVTGYLRQRVATEIGKEPVAYQRLVDPAVAEDLNKLPYNTSFPEVHAILSKAKEAARVASNAGEGNKARIMGKIAKAIEDELNSQLMRARGQNGAAVRQRFQNANRLSRFVAKTYKENPIGGALAKDRSGAPAVQPSAMAKSLLQPGAGQQERWEAFKKAVNNNPHAIATARDWVANQLIDSAINIDGTVSPAKLKAFLKANASLMRSDIFNPNQKLLIDQINRAANMAQKVAQGGAKGHTNTAADLLGQKYVNVLIGGMTNKALHATGAGLGFLAGHTLGSAVGEFGGIYGGFKAAEWAGKGMEKLYELPAEAVRKLLLDALRDPALAVDLMRQASRSTSLPRTLQRYLAQNVSLNQSGVLPAAREARAENAH